MEVTVKNNLKEHIKWFASNDKQDVLLHGFTFSKFLFDQEQPSGPFQFSDDPHKKFPVIKFVGKQEKSLDDYLVGKNTQNQSTKNGPQNTGVSDMKKEVTATLPHSNSISNINRNPPTFSRSDSSSNLGQTRINTNPQINLPRKDSNNQPIVSVNTTTGFPDRTQSQSNSISNTGTGGRMDSRQPTKLNHSNQPQIDTPDDLDDSIQLPWPSSRPSKLNHSNQSQIVPPDESDDFWDIDPDDYVEQATIDPPSDYPNRSSSNKAPPGNNCDRPSYMGNVDKIGNTGNLGSSRGLSNKVVNLPEQDPDDAYNKYETSYPSGGPFQGGNRPPSFNNGNSGGNGFFQANNREPSFNNDTSGDSFQNNKQQQLFARPLPKSQTNKQANSPAKGNEISAWSKNFEWSKKIEEALFQVFGHHHWRENQREIVNATMADKDVFVTMPTGGGKSLCFQIPAVCSNKQGLTLVVSPLLSLIEDQVMIIKTLDIPVSYLGTNQSEEETSLVFKDLSSGNPKLRILFVTPERIVRSEHLLQKIQILYNRNKIDRFVIDEAHCVSQWGHDFRPDYKELRILKQKFPDVPILAMTATATEKVTVDILQTLNISNNVIKFSASFNRPNLLYEIRKKGSKKNCLKDIASFVQTNYKNKSGIIYCFSRRECEVVSTELSSQGLNTAPYHADMDKVQRSQVQQQWSRGRIKIVCATIAFGMGINKPDVRFVIHFTLPKSLEGYYQESGRAGRDGKVSHSLLYYTYADKTRLENLIETSLRETGAHPLVISRQREMLWSVVQFCENTVDCRRTMTLQYFGEKFDPSDCGPHLCDNCTNRGEVEQRDLTQQAKHIVDIIQQFSKQGLKSDSATPSAVAEIYRGGESRRMSQYRNFPHYGAAKPTGLSKDDLSRLIHTMLVKNILEESFRLTEYGSTLSSLRIGRESQNLVKGKITITLTFSKKKKTARQSPAKKKKPVQEMDQSEEEVEEEEEEDTPVIVPKASAATKLASFKRPEPSKAAENKLREQLLTELFDLRDAIFAEDKKFGGVHGDNASVILSDASIQQITKVLPKNVTDFGYIDGVGKTRADKYGPRFLRHIMEFCEKHPTLMPKGDKKDNATHKPNSNNQPIIMNLDDDDPSTTDDDFQEMKKAPRNSQIKARGAISSYFVEKQQNSTRNKPTTTTVLKPNATPSTGKGLKRTAEAVPLSQAKRKPDLSLYTYQSKHT